MSLTGHALHFEGKGYFLLVYKLLRFFHTDCSVPGPVLTHLLVTDSTLSVASYFLQFSKQPSFVCRALSTFDSHSRMGVRHCGAVIFVLHIGHSGSFVVQALSEITPRELRIISHCLPTLEKVYYLNLVMIYCACVCACVSHS